MRRGSIGHFGIVLSQQIVDLDDIILELVLTLHHRYEDSEEYVRLVDINFLGYGGHDKKFINHDPVEGPDFS